MTEETEEVPAIPQEKEMSFLEHLEELRWHIVRSTIAILVFTVGLFIAKDFLFGTIIFAPTQTDFWTFRMLCKLGDLVSLDFLCFGDFPFELQSRQMMGQFMMHVTASFIGGFIISFPYVFFEIWRFISPGLYSNEKNVSKGAVFFVSLLFSIGVLFGYYIVTPVAVNFFANYSVYAEVKNQFDITNYVTTVAILVLGSGILFQLPIVTYFTTKVGLVTPELMIKYRKHSIVVIFILSAMITPPDPFTQIFIGVPLIFLYQISIMISRSVIRKQAKQEQQEQQEIQLRKNP
ncbi:MAG: twin-arginine translocase subunit TatC [Cyclobacteriaceae bacterium]|nr:twin-arginine translocase subunit TatC [Cyclobacteriaceae bacterium]